MSTNSNSNPNGEVLIGEEDDINDDGPICTDDQERVFKALAVSSIEILSNRSLKLRANHSGTAGIPWYKPWCRLMYEGGIRSAMKNVRRARQRRDRVWMVTSEVTRRLDLQSAALLEGIKDKGREVIESLVVSDQVAAELSERLEPAFLEIHEQALITFRRKYSARKLDIRDFEDTPTPAPTPPSLPLPLPLSLPLPLLLPLPLP